MTGAVRNPAAFLLVLLVTMSVAAPASADPIHDAQWYLSFLNIDKAHEYSQGDGVIVGVIDTGVDGNHPDLAGSVLPGAGLTPAGGDGRQDPYGHGTAMAGLIAAHGRIQGIAPKAKILPVSDGAEVLYNHYNGGIRWAVDHGATVLCLAYNGPDDPVAREETQYAIDKGAILIAAVGNTDLGRAGPDPLEYPGVVGAAGVDRAGNHSSISIITPYATLAAPSDDIYSTDTLAKPGNTGYLHGTGTSNSTAIIAGAAALVRSKYPNLSATEVIHRLTATADDKGPPGRDDQYGYGVINIVKALTADVPPLTPTTTPDEPSAVAQPPANNGNTSKTNWALIGGLTLVALLAAAALTVGLVRLRHR